MADELVFKLTVQDEGSAKISAFTQQLQGLEREISTAGRQVFGEFRKNFNQAFGDLGKPINSVNEFKSALLGLSGAYAAIGVKKAGEFIADSVKNFASYEQALAGVQRTVGMTDEQINALGESLRTLALVDLKGQVTADQLAAIAEAAGQMGITAEEDILAFAEAVAQVSVATGQDMEKTALSFGRIADLFKESLGADAYQKIGNIGSAFDALADSSSASVEGILAYTNRLAGTATALGLTVDQTAAIGATLESMGVPAERGSTAISKVFLQLKKDSASFADALDLDATKLKTALETKPVEAVNMVIDAMAKMNKERPTEFLTTMEDLLGKGSGVTEVVLKLSEGSEQLATNMGVAAKAMDEGTRAGESFATAADTQLGSWTAIKTAVDDLSKSVGQQLQPTLNVLGNWLNLAAGWWASAFRAENINAFFDDVVAGWGLIKAEADNFGKAWNDVMAGLKKEWDTFVKAITDSVQAVKKVVDDVKGIIKEAIPGGDKGSVSIGGFEKGTVASLEAIKVANLDLIKSNQELKQEYFAVKNAFDAAYKNGGKPTQELVDSTVRLSQVMKAAGGETAGFKVLLDQLRDSTLGVDDAYEGHSLTPALQRYIQAAMSAGTTTQGLTQETLSTMQAVLDADKAYQSLEKDLNQNQRAVLAVEKSMQELKQVSVNASDFEKKRIAEELKGLQVKRSELMIEKKEIQSRMDLTREEIDMGKDVIKVFEDQQKAAEDAAKARIKAEETLQENTQRTAELRQQQMQEEMRAANDLYREQQKQAADSLKWLDQLDDATKKRVMGEEDAVKVLKAQGVTLTTLQEQELRRMQGAYKTEQAYEAQAKALAAQLSPMSALMAAGDKLSSGIGGLSSGIGNLGSLFNIDTSGIQKALGSIQQFAELPQMFAGIKESIGSIGEAFGQLKNLDLKNIFSGGGGLSGMLSSLSGIGSVAGIIMAAWGPLKDFFKGLFADTKSQGTEAANAFQEFVAKNVTGGAEMAGALKESFSQMSQANFDYQTFLQQTGSTMSQVMGGLSANWQQGTTAMDIFTQAVVKSGVEVSKAPQIALQAMAGFDQMGLSVEQAGIKMLEIAEAAGLSEAQLQALQGELSGASAGADTYAAAVTNATAAAQNSISSNQSLAASTNSISSGYANAADAIRDFAQAQQQAAIIASMQGIPTAATGGIVSGLAIVNERGPEIAKFPGGGMALMTAKGATLSAFPAGTQIIPHQESMSILSRYPNIPRMAMGGTVGSMGGTVINVNITGNNITKDTDLRALAREVSAEISKSYRARA